MNGRHWLLGTRLWLFNTVGWAIITLTTHLPQAMWLMLGCLVMTLWSNRRWRDANEGRTPTRNSEDEQ